MRPITAGDLMNPEILTVSEEMSVEEAAAFLTEHEITGAPVENSNGDFVGVISVVDIAAGSFSGSRLVAELMTPDIQAVPEEATVSEVASLMLDDHLHRVLVIRDEQPVGIISTSDLLGLLVDED
ncbi:MAG: CBS domain-containing protein [Thermoanaerobaculia bacterium]